MCMYICKIAYIYVGFIYGGFTHGIDTRKLLRKLHNHANNERRSQSRAAYKLHHRDRRLSLLSSLLRFHLLDIFLHLVTGSQPSQSFSSLFLPLFSNEQISEIVFFSSLKKGPCDSQAKCCKRNRDFFALKYSFGHTSCSC